jgi:RimJ/RimL family protein N-acetyltransferase
VTRRVVDHAFRNLGLHKVNSDYLEPNAASRAIHERVGFVEEGRLREDAWRQGRWIDRILLSLLASEWRGTAS